MIAKLPDDPTNLSKREAMARLHDYAADMPRLWAELQRRYRLDRGSNDRGALSFDPESLEPLWSWASAQFESSKPGDPDLDAWTPPLWATRTFASGFSAATIDLLHLLSAHFAGVVFKNLPGYRLALGRASTKHYIYYNYPVIIGHGTPFMPFLTSVARSVLAPPEVTYTRKTAVGIYERFAARAEEPDFSSAEERRSTVEVPVFWRDESFDLGQPASATDASCHPSGDDPLDDVADILSDPTQYVSVEEPDQEGFDHTVEPWDEALMILDVATGESGDTVDLLAERIRLDKRITQVDRPDREIILVAGSKIDPDELKVLVISHIVDIVGGATQQRRDKPPAAT